MYAQEIELRVERRVQETQRVFLDLPFGIEASDIEETEYSYHYSMGDVIVLTIDDTNVRYIAQNYMKLLPDEGFEPVAWYSDEKCYMEVTKSSGSLRGRIYVPFAQEDFESEYDDIEAELY